MIKRDDELVDGLDDRRRIRSDSDVGVMCHLLGPLLANEILDKEHSLAVCERNRPDGPVTPAVNTVRYHHPHLEPHRLPVSWRLSARCAPLVADGFYPQLPFRAGTATDDRALTATKPPSAGTRTEFVDAINMAADNGWCLLRLPPRISPGIDVHAVDAVARTVVTALQLGLHATDTSGDDGPVGPSRIAVGVAHRNQRSAIRIRLDEIGADVGLDVSGVTVETANRLQGREFHLVVVLHPLSGRPAASDFHLETGRLCVLLSRHRHACIVVARDGIRQVLDDHPQSRPIWIGAPVPSADGWEANQLVLDHLDAVSVAVLSNSAGSGP